MASSILDWGALSKLPRFFFGGGEETFGEHTISTTACDESAPHVGSESTTPCQAKVLPSANVQSSQRESAAFDMNRIPLSTTENSVQNVGLKRVKSVVSGSLANIRQSPSLAHISKPSQAITNKPEDLPRPYLTDIAVGPSNQPPSEHRFGTLKVDHCPSNFDSQSTFHDLGSSIRRVRSVNAIDDISSIKGSTNRRLFSAQFLPTLGETLSNDGDPPAPTEDTIGRHPRSICVTSATHIS